jgi:hypothetical protein
MGLYQQPGYKRLAIGIPVVVFLVFFIVSGAIGDEFIYSLSGSVVGAILAYALTRLVYWVVDGFKCSE